MPFEKERQFYRTQIPPGDVAVFRVGPLHMPILEISERGFRYARRLTTTRKLAPDAW